MSIKFDEESWRPKDITWRLESNCSTNEAMASMWLVLSKLIRWLAAGDKELELRYLASITSAVAATLERFTN